jgi:hypothetical protein
LGLRGHAAAERFSAGEQRQAGHEPLRFHDRRAHRRLRKLRRIGPLPAALHVRKLVAQCGNAALRQIGGDRLHERMLHAGARAMRQHVAGAGSRRLVEQAGHAHAFADRNGNAL